MNNTWMDLTWFGEDGAEAPAAAAESAGSETAGTEPETAQQTPAAPANVSARVAAEMERQMRRHPELREKYGRKPEAAAPQAAETVQRPADAPEKQAEADAEAELQARWEAAKKGEFAKFYGQDVQAAIKDRFKNQQDATAELDAYRNLEPALKVLRERAGVSSNDELAKQIMDDDSLYEEAANEHGMTIPAYREFMKAKEQLEQYQQQENQRQETMRIQQHFGKLREQEAAMKQMYPDFSLEKELKDPNFMRLTSPDVGISVEDAYYAVHHRELAPQMMAYGMERAKQQMGQTIQAQRSRPAEGAMKAQGQPAAAMKLDPRQMTRKEREEIKRQVRLGKRVSFD